MLFHHNWNLTRYFYTNLDDPKFLTDIANIMPLTEAFAFKYKKSFSQFTKPTEMLEFYTDYTKLSYDMAKPSYYLFYLSSLDTQDLTVLKKMGEVDYIYTEASNLLLFISQGWKEIGYDRIMEWSKDPLMVPYKNDLISTADGIKHIL